MDERKKIIEIIEKIGATPDKLIEILLAVQSLSHEHYVSEEQLKLIAQKLNIPLSKAYGVASFYSMLSTKKKGRYVIQICNSGPCYVSKANGIVKALENRLGIHIGEITNDQMFSMEYTSCFGACHLAPAIKINEEVYGNLNPQKVNQIIDKLIKEVV
ncbi:NADH-quinone oxidoreductase subunit NuoE family protein [Alkaliphilus hydrothermalis]|uniref:NADH-quinone oxidoreductase subunit E n=1 Tax=Alkaliphilus hydrothermalis TaxID=1482730 RepID=A0ABS2NSF7_9FIRM|nr:NAD(P)H-dependent oxidoreductase subunit E [Alkaliphilus hydrothermalis]MBM7615888.1 NADH-quinone oxidoreductase subunit E [Alkaliphilus hydrothermalis]